MFFAFCCELGEDGNVAALQQNQSIQPTVTPPPLTEDEIIEDLLRQTQSKLPIVTPAIVYAARNNWSIIIFMMRLDLRDQLRRWFNLRKENVEADTADVNPSFELLSVALWLNMHEYLQTLTANHDGNLAAYLESRREECDALDQTLWHFADWGMLPDLPRKSLPAIINLPTQDLAILRLFSTLYSFDPPAIVQLLKEVLKTRGINNTWQDLAKIGCWQGLLIGVVTGFVDPNSTNCFDYLLQAKEFWARLKTAPRSTIPDRPSLETLIRSPEIPAELRFAYLAFQFNQPEYHYYVEGTKHSSKNKIYYSKCMNTMLTNCFNEPQPALLELFCYCTAELIRSLDVITTKAMRPQLQQLYPSAVPALDAVNASTLQLVPSL